MIYTLTLNPSLDYIVSVDDFKTGCLNRTCKELLYPGGKGINVSMVLKNLGYDSTALGLIAGFTGDQLDTMLRERSITTDFVRVKRGLTRINIKIRSGAESEINGQGPMLDDDEIDLLYDKLEELKEDDILIFGGSIPNTLQVSIYSDIMKRLYHKNLKIIVDVSGDPLLNILKYNPFLIKPNHIELGEIYGVEVSRKEEVIPYAGRLKALGAQNVLVSMAGNGAVLVSNDGKIHTMEAPGGVIKNSVGAGDSMVAGFIAGYLETMDYKEALRMGICAGSASAFSEELATREEFEQLLRQIERSS